MILLDIAGRKVVGLVESESIYVLTSQEEGKTHISGQNQHISRQERAKSEEEERKGKER